MRSKRGRREVVVVAFRSVTLGIHICIRGRRKHVVKEGLRTQGFGDLEDGVDTGKESKTSGVINAIATRD